MDQPQPEKPKKWKVWARRLFPFMVLGGILLGLNFVLEPLLNWFDAALIGLARSASGVGAVFIVWAVMAAFLSVTPGGGTLPPLVAGASFPYYIAWPIAWTAASAGSGLNLLMVRLLCHPLCKSSCKNCENRCTSVKKRFVAVSSVDKALCEHTGLLVMLLRLPGLGACVFNYLFSTSSMPPVRYLCFNTLAHVSGTALWTGIGTTGRSIIEAVRGHGGTMSLGLAIAILVCIIVTIVGLGIFSKQWAKRRGFGAEDEELAVV